MVSITSAVDDQGTLDALLIGHGRIEFERLEVPIIGNAITVPGVYALQFRTLEWSVWHLNPEDRDIRVAVRA